MCNYIANFYSLYTKFLNSKSLLAGCFSAVRLLKISFWGMSHTDCDPKSQLYHLPPCFVVAFRSVAVQSEDLLLSLY